MTESLFMFAHAAPALPDDRTVRPGQPLAGKEPSHPTEERLRALLLAGLDGDAVAYRDFLSELSGRLRAFLRKRLQNMQDEVEDVVQETLVEAWRHLETLREPARFHAWLDGICRNICRRQKRKDDTLSLHEQRIGSLFDPDATGEMDAWLDLSTSMTHPEFWESLSSPRQLICVVKPHEEGNRAVRG